MENRENNNAPGVDPIKHSMRESCKVGTSDVAVDALKHLGNPFDRIECGVNRRKEFLP
jgi:hypothetical protein